MAAPVGHELQIGVEPPVEDVMHEAPTIFALSSGPGRAGVAVIRLSGPGAGRALDLMAAPLPRPRVAAFRRIREPTTAEVLDEGLVLWFPGPASETGEDVAEFQVHGSPAVIRAIFAALASMSGFRLAEPGEFARRAFENGKLDLTAAEGLADLIDAETEAQRRQALGHLRGAFGDRCDAWRDRLLQARALMEAAIDFSDEADVAVDAIDAARTAVLPALEDIASCLAEAHRGEIVRDGFRVVLAGPPNAGKSSLLNALARRDVAIVSPEPGTTRDSLEVRLDLGGYPVILSDTAGLRDALEAGLVEREGMRRTLLRAAEADLLVWLVDGEAPQWDPPPDLLADGPPVLGVLNKLDLSPGLRSLASQHGAVPVSALSGAGLPELVTRLAGAVAARMTAGTTPDQAIPTQFRHRQALEDCRASLRRIADRPDLEPELAAEELRHAADALGRITGRIDAEEVLGAIFGRFCIGK